MHARMLACTYSAFLHTKEVYKVAVIVAAVRTIGTYSVIRNTTCSRKREC